MNRVALITGGSRGIGRGIARELAREGFDLVINFATNAEAARHVAAECTALAAAAGRAIRAETCQADIADGTARGALLEFTRRTFARLDLLVNNAGVAPTVRTDLLETSEASFDRVVGINVRAPFFLTQAAASWMLDQVRTAPAGGPRPQIVFVSSISAYTASINRGEYCVAKAALAMLTPLFATRLADHGIHVYEIRPGLIETDMTAPVKSRYAALIADGLTPIRRWGTPEDVGKAVAALARGALPFSTGEVLNVDGGFHLRRL